MEKYDYRSAVSEGIREYLKDNEIVVTPINRVEIENKLNEDLIMSDSVTGNASGSGREFCDDLGEWIKKGAETCDVIIRCYLVPSCLSGVLDEVEIQIETLQELADYINEAEEIPENVMGIIEANEWEDLTEKYDEVCSDGYEKVIMENGKAVVREIEEEEE